METERAHDPLTDGEATTLGPTPGRHRPSRATGEPDPSSREVIAVRAGAGHLSGRGTLVASAVIPVIPTLVKPRGAILRFRLAALLAAQLFDFGTFTVMIGRHGIVAEVNPIVAQGFDAFGMPILAISKVALIVLLGSIVVLLAREVPSRRPTPRLAAAITLLAVLGGLIGGISNVLAG